MTEAAGPLGDAVSETVQIPTGPVPGPVPIERTMARLLDRAGQVTTARATRRLLSANRAIVGELSLPIVLERIVEVARDLVRARYGAIGVIGPDGRFEQFVHLGMDADTVAAIGDLPEGKGVLGVLIEDPRPIRLPKISDMSAPQGFRRVILRCRGSSVSRSGSTTRSSESLSDRSRRWRLHRS